MQFCCYSVGMQSGNKRQRTNKTLKCHSWNVEAKIHPELTIKPHDSISCMHFTPNCAHLHICTTSYLYIFIISVHLYIYTSAYKTKNMSKVCILNETHD